MKPLTLEWINKAEGDFATSGRELRARKSPNFDSACFHAQQCAEKYLKARLVEAGISFSKTHDLLALLVKALTVEPTWQALLQDLAVLNTFSVDYRYPGSTALRSDARDGYKRCVSVRKTIRGSFGLPT